MSRFNNSTIIIALILVIVIAGLGIINFSDIDIPYLNWVKKGIYNVITPVVEFFSNCYNSVQRYWYTLMNINQIMKENKNLKEKIAEYEMKDIMYNYYRFQNQRLKELLSFQEDNDFQSTGARVIGYSPDNWNNRIMIDVGTTDGIRERMPVISYHGALVGRIVYAGAFTSQVLLINDSEYIVGGIVQRPDSRAIGIVRGQLNNDFVNIMDNISWNTKSKEGDIKNGDIIVTSGLSNSYPRGLPIGEVTKVEKDNYGLSQRAEIDLFINERTIEEVMVITGFEGGEDN